MECKYCCKLSGKSKLFWKEVSKVGNKREEVITCVKTLDGNEIQDETEVKER